MEKGGRGNLKAMVAMKKSLVCIGLHVVNYTLSVMAVANNNMPKFALTLFGWHLSLVQADTSRLIPFVFHAYQIHTEKKEPREECILPVSILLCTQYYLVSFCLQCRLNSFVSLFEQEREFKLSSMHCLPD